MKKLIISKINKMDMDKIWIMTALIILVTSSANLMQKPLAWVANYTLTGWTVLVSIILIIKEKTNKNKDFRNVFVLGSPGAGKAHHPWDDLKACPCGCKERPLLMYEKDVLFYCGGPTNSIFAICHSCGRHTNKSDIITTITNWNDDIVEEEKDKLGGNKS